MGEDAVNTFGCDEWGLRRNMLVGVHHRRVGVFERVGSKLMIFAHFIEKKFDWLDEKIE